MSITIESHIKNMIFTILSNNKHVKTLICYKVEFDYKSKRTSTHYDCKFLDGAKQSVIINLPFDYSLRQLMQREKQNHLGTIITETFDLLNYQVVRYLVTIKI